MFYLGLTGRIAHRGLGFGLEAEERACLKARMTQQKEQENLQLSEHKQSEITAYDP